MIYCIVIRQKRGMGELILNNEIDICNLSADNVLIRQPNLKRKSRSFEAKEGKVEG